MIDLMLIATTTSAIGLCRLLQQPFVGKPFLDRARELIGDEITEFTQAVDVDIAQSLMDLKDDYQGRNKCIPIT